MTPTNLKQACREHAVGFYDTEDELTRLVGGYVAAAVRSDETAIVAASSEHLRAFEAALTASGLDVEMLRASASLITLDAADVARRLTATGSMDPVAFEAIVGEVVRAAGRRDRPIRVYGEIVAMLWDEGQVLAAIELEELWNGLRGEIPFSLLCAYPNATVAGEANAAALEHVHRLHSDLVDPDGVVDEHGVVLADEERRFPLELASPLEVRRFAREVLSSAAPEVVDAALLIGTELATNAMAHARSDFSVRLTRRLGTIRIAVADRDTAPPTIANRATLEANGNGLGLIARMSRRWGHEVDDAGKVVWAELSE